MCSNSVPGAEEAAAVWMMAGAGEPAIDWAGDEPFPSISLEISTAAKQMAMSANAA